MQPGIFEEHFALMTSWQDCLETFGLIGAPSDLDKRYFWKDETLDKFPSIELTGCGVWTSLQVTTSLSIKIIKMAFYIVISVPDTFGHLIQDYPNALAEFLEYPRI